MRQMITARLQRSWDLRAAGNFIGGGAGTGLVLAATVATLSTGADLRLILLAGLVLIGLGLAMVWLEIGKPWRALNVFFHPQTSWMTREGIVAMALYAVGSGAALLSSPGLLGLMALVAMGFVWCQGRILTSAKGIPAWRAGLTLPLILATAAAEGAGAAVLLAGVTGADVPWLGRGLALLLALRYVVWRAYLARLKAPAQAMAAARRLDMPLVLAGHLLPALLAVFGLSLAAGLLAVVAGWVLKYVLITRMAMTQGFALPVTPARGRGTTGTGVKPGWGAAS